MRKKSSSNQISSIYLIGNQMEQPGSNASSSISYKGLLADSLNK